MIQGEVNSNYQALISLRVEGPDGRAEEIAVIVDTGFTGYLMLPPGLVADLGLLQLGSNNIILANGARVRLDVYGAVVIWDGARRYVRVYVADGSPLVGMRMLLGYDLSAQVRVGGRVIIEASN